MKLNVGCSWPKGKYKQDEWINLDLLGNKRVNVRGDALELPFDVNSIDEVHCAHLLEHLRRDKYPQVLREMHRVVKQGGYVYVEVPDLRGTIDLLHQSFNLGDVFLIQRWTTSIYGKNEIKGMAHYWGFYEGLLRRDLRLAGFKDVVRLTKKEDMISEHYCQEPILLVRGTK